MGQETSAPIHQNCSQLQLPIMNIAYPKGPCFTAELEQPEPTDNVKNQVPDHVLEKLSTDMHAPLITETQKKKSKPLIYRREPEQLQKDAVDISKPLDNLPMKRKCNVKK